MTPEAIDLNKNPVLGMLMNTQAFNTKIVELAGTNFNSAVKYAETLSKARSGQEFADLVVDQVRDQFEAMSEQVEEGGIKVEVQHYFQDFGMGLRRSKLLLGF